MSLQPSLEDLARKANGIGIICGLEVIVAPDCTLTITSGVGITSKGLLLDFYKTNYKHYQPYDRPVRGLTRDGDGIEVWELLPTPTENSTPLTPQVIGDRRFIDCKVALIRLWGKCQKTVLLIDKEDLWELLQNLYQLDIQCLPIEGVEPEDIELFDYGDEDCPSGTALYCGFHRNTSLKPIAMMRFGFATGESECDPEERDFKIKTADFEGIFKEYELIVLDALRKLQKGIDDLHAESFYDLFPEQQRYYLNQYFVYLRGKRLLTFLNGPRRCYIQIFHD